VNATYLDAFGNQVSVGDTVVWAPSGISRLVKRVIVKIELQTKGPGNWGSGYRVTACNPGDEDRPATHRVINERASVIYSPGA
jgi:hypothetical protein